MARVPFPIRERNWLGGPVDIKNPNWAHQNLRIYGDAISKVASAFATDDPFTALGYAEDQFTRSIEKWFARPCQVDNSYLILRDVHGAGHSFLRLLGKGTRITGALRVHPAV